MNPVNILSLNEVRKKLHLEEEIVRISITDWDINEHTFISGKYIKASLCLEFCDVTYHEVKKNKEFSVFQESLFSWEQARQVIDFLKKYIDFPLVVNCLAGISRSSAIGKIACQLKGIDDSWIRLPRYNPNPYVLQLLQNQVLLQHQEYCSDKFSK